MKQRTTFRYTLMLQDNGSEWTRIYDGTSKRTFLNHFCFWSRKTGCALLAVCPRDTDRMLDIEWTAATDVRYY
jgi:hypothetical protein